ncbi:MAG: ParB/RepB/Spo0J family partition protein [Deltaproteobacteria bacterium]|jgi:ParB family chromosome partitioning protein|nr:ParB/RepB/Spo0J family partition protein [Deltaproteobacteria bacterium]
MSKPKQKALGSGLGQLIPIEGATSGGQILGQAAAAGSPLYLRPSDIAKNPDQPRKNINNEELIHLADSIREKGILEPLVVAKTEKGYQLIAGYRRLLAADILKLEKVPVYVMDIKGGPAENLELALIENIIRQDLNPMEEAEAFERLEKEFRKDVKIIAKMVSKDSSTVKNAIRLLKLPEPVQQDIRESRLSAGHGKALLGLEDNQELLMRARGEILARALTVRQAENLVKRHNKAKKTKTTREREEENAYYDSLCGNISDALNGLKVEIIHHGKNKKIIINYNNKDNIELFLKKLNIIVKS